MTTVYMDAATAAPLHPAAVEAMRAALADGWADPDKIYAQSRRAQLLLDAAREAVADVIGAHPDEVSFTGNGTQSVHAAVLGAAAAGPPGRVFAHTTVEHSAVLHAAHRFAADGGDLVSVPVGRTGRVDADEFEAALRGHDVALAAVQSANHELGTVQPVDELAERCGDVPLLVDAAQTLGHAPVPTRWSLLAASARKWGGPPGLGVLAVRRAARWRSPWPDDEAEAGRVPGAVNLPSIVAAAAALRAAVAEQDAEDRRLRALTDRIRREVPARVPYARVVGDPVERLPHIVTLSYPYESGQPLMYALDREGIAVSAGSSCTSSALRPSHVLDAIGVLSGGNIRVSLHRQSTESDVDRFLAVLPEVVARLRDEAGVADL